VSRTDELYVLIGSTDVEEYGGIPGITNRRLQFLGLLNCAYRACDRPNLPAVQVSSTSYHIAVLKPWLHVQLIACNLLRAICCRGAKITVQLCKITVQ